MLKATNAISYAHGFYIYEGFTEVANAAFAALASSRFFEPLNLFDSAKNLSEFFKKVVLFEWSSPSAVLFFFGAPFPRALPLQ